MVARFGLFLGEIAPTEPARSLRQTNLSLWIGTALVALGILVTVFAAAEHLRVVGRLDRGEPYRPPRSSTGVAVAAALALVGVAFIVRLMPGIG